MGSTNGVIMKKSLRVTAHLLGTLCLFVLVSASVSAQKSGLVLTVDEPHVTDFPDYQLKTIDYPITVLNPTSAPIDLYVVRLVNNLPEQGMLTQVCLGDKCYNPEEYEYPVVKVAPGTSPFCKITLTTPLKSQSDARIVLTFQNGMGGGVDTVEIIGMESRTSAVEYGSGVVSILNSYPNPAVADVAITLPQGAVIGAGATLRIYDAMGAEVADRSAEAAQAVGTSSVRFSVADLRSGAYFYRLTVNEREYAGSMTVAR